MTPEDGTGALEFRAVPTEVTSMHRAVLLAVFVSLIVLGATPARGGDEANVTVNRLVGFR